MIHIVKDKPILQDFSQECTCYFPIQFSDLKEVRTPTFKIKIISVIYTHLVPPL